MQFATSTMDNIVTIGKKDLVILQTYSVSKQETGNFTTTNFSFFYE